MSFHSLLKIGIAYEEKVLKALHKKYPLATRISGQFVDYDIWIPELHKSVEVKFDKKSEETNNIIIEYERNNKPGDILTTKASYWCIHTASGFLWIKPIKIIECILREDCRHINVNNAKCYLIPIHILYSYSIRGEL
jgi:hypothetical protein